MRKIVVAILSVLATYGASVAQRAAAVAPLPPDLAPPGEGDQQQKMTLQDVEDSVRAHLGQAGFTEIQMVPMTILVHAKDSDGNAVTFVVSPKSLADADVPQANPRESVRPAIPGEEKF